MLCCIRLSKDYYYSAAESSELSRSLRPAADKICQCQPVAPVVTLAAYRCPNKLQISRHHIQGPINEHSSLSQPHYVITLIALHRHRSFIIYILIVMPS